MSPMPLGARLAGAALIASSILVGSSASVRAADTSNIPGIPFTGTVAIGQLGGPIYDAVYSLDVQPGAIILVSLTGSVGTDFDLYLFDSTATTVYTNAGLVAKSTGPTSTESLSVPSPSGGTYYLDLNGASNVEGTYQVVVQQVADTTPPVISAVSIDGGRSATNDPSVTVSATASDNLSGVYAMSLSDDGTTWSPWGQYSNSATWTLPPGDGKHTVWVRVRNGVGLISSPAHASIVLDTVPPTVVSIEPAPGSQAIDLQPSLSVQFNEPIDPSSWQNLGLIVQAASGALVTGSYTYDPTTFTGSFTPGVALVPGQPYVATLAAVTDVAGNTVAPIGSWLLTAASPTSLSATPSPAVVVLGASARIDASLVGVPGPAALRLSQRVAGGAAFVDMGSLDLSGGIGSVFVAPSATTTYRISYAGTSTLAPSEADVLVSVRRAVRIAGPATGFAGRTVNVTATIGPAHGGVSVSFRLYRYDPFARIYRYAGSWGRSTSSTGLATYLWTPRSGTYYWRAVVAGTAQYATNSSAILRVAIR